MSRLNHLLGIKPLSAEEVETLQRNKANYDQWVQSLPVQELLSNLTKARAAYQGLAEQESLKASPNAALALTHVQHAAFITTVIDHIRNRTSL